MLGCHLIKPVMSCHVIEIGYTDTQILILLINIDIVMLYIDFRKSLKVNWCTNKSLVKDPLTSTCQVSLIKEH